MSTDVNEVAVAAVPNLLDELDRALERATGDDGPLASLVVPHNVPGCDVFLAGRRSGWAAEAGPALGGALTAHPAVREAELDPARNRLLVRLADERVAALGAALEAVQVEPFLGRDVATSERFVVDYCDPNATKALHVGHLRTVALGHALGCLAASCGADVVHQTQIGDVGRQMGEAMAGYLEHFAPQTPESAGVKSDHFVGACYSRYVADLAPPEVGGGAERDPALSREDGSYDDLAERLLERLGAGDPEVVELWRRMREWALRGHDATLARLGVIFDRVIYEVDFLADTHALTATALEQRLVRRSDDGAVVSHEREDGHLLLHRPDGFPTTHMRCMGMWHLTGRDILAGTTSLALVGDEWEPLVQQGPAILEGLAAGGEIHPTHWVVHGMVTSGRGAIKSSGGAPWLVDQLLDDLVADARLRAHANERATPERLAAVAALGICIDIHPRKALPLESEMLLDERANAGWTLARAWARAWDPTFDGAPAPHPDDADYRSLVLRSQLHRRLAERSLRALDVRPLLGMHVHAAEWFLAQEDPSPSVARATRGLLECGMRAVGLAPDPLRSEK
ncbi:MAG: arginine--tRNA ligase [Actinobacteria bacterium]|nr:arginine--tRNA ligase [Actinomycetota bacterium]